MLITLKTLADKIAVVKKLCMARKNNCVIS